MLSALMLISIANIFVSDLKNSFLSPSFPSVSSSSACRLFVKLSVKFRGPSVESPPPSCLNRFSLSSCSTSLKSEIGSIFLFIFSLISLDSISKRLVSDIFWIAIWLFYNFFCYFFASFLLSRTRKYQYLLFRKHHIRH